MAFAALVFSIFIRCAPQSLSGASWVCLLALRACTQDPFARRVM